MEEVIARTTRALGPALSKGALRLPIDEVYRFEEAPEACERMAQNKHFGKIILANA